jgi:hypothetical protein
MSSAQATVMVVHGNKIVNHVLVFSKANLAAEIQAFNRKIHENIDLISKDPIRAEPLQMNDKDIWCRPDLELFAGQP